jgi:outer membrane protein assembly factor BamB
VLQRTIAVRRCTKAWLGEPDTWAREAHGRVSFEKLPMGREVSLQDLDMLTITRILPALLILCCFAERARAQSAGMLPAESMLGANGLMLDWWAQAAVNSSRDSIRFFSADEQNVYVQSTSGITTAFQGETGERLWSQLLGSPEQQGFRAVTNDDQVVVAIGMKLYSLDKRTGKPRWELELAGPPSAPPEIDDSHIFVGTMSGAIYAYDLIKIENLYARGMLPKWTVRARLWNFQVPLPIVSQPYSNGQQVMFGSERGVVYALLADSKQLRFQLETSGRIHAPLAFSKDFCLVADSDSRMLCIRQIDGQVVWIFASGAPIRQQPRIIGQQVFVVPHREGLTAISTTSGVVQWRQIAATELIAVSENHVYASDLNNNVLILDRTQGEVLGVMEFRRFPVRISNDRTDRILMANPGGTVISIREVGSDYPIYHLNPERRPILPELAADEAAE